MATGAEGTKMSSGSYASLRRIQEDFLHCSVCLEEFKEPKVLPCLHRFCTECLKLVVDNFKKFKCPLCKIEHARPPNGVDGYKTDFAMKNILEALQESAETLKIEEKRSEAVDMTPKSPLCCYHTDKPANYCCISCGNTPVCHDCCTGSGSHRGHAYQKVEELARIEGDNLIEALAMLSHCRKSVTMLQDQFRAEHDNVYECGGGGETESLHSRFENTWELAKSMFESGDDWTKIHLVPGVKKVSEDLTKEIKRLSSSLMSTDIYTPMHDLSGGKVVHITQQTGCIDVMNSDCIGWEINCMTSCGNGVIVMTGKVTEVSSHVTVFNVKGGKITRQDKIQRQKQFRFGPKRYCATLSTFQVATVCIPDEVGVYDVRNGSFKSRNISDLCDMWESTKYVMCVAVETVRKEIIVGSHSSKALFVFDRLLNFKRFIKLPEVLRWPRDLSVHSQDTILVCDYTGKRACAVKTAGQHESVSYELTKPNVDGDRHVTPFRLCVDHSMNVYVMWEKVSSSSDRGVIVAQYSKNGGELISQIQVNDDARNFTATMTKEGEKLLLSTRTGNKLFVHDIE